MFKIFALLVTVFSLHKAHALDTLVDRPKGAVKGLVIIAPAKKYLMGERLFAELAAHLTAEGYVTVRFNWSPDTFLDPQLELARAARDIYNMTVFSQNFFKIRSEKTVLISKSFSTKAIVPSIQLARTHILLTPNCSAEQPFKQTYQNILDWPGISLRIIISNEDPYCQVDEIRKTLGAQAKLGLLLMTHGDHNFVLTTPTTNQSSYEYQDQVIQSITAQLQPKNTLVK